jgi:hypothetical protein
MDNPLSLLLHPIIAPALGGVVCDIPITLTSSLTYCHALQLTHVVCHYHEPSSLPAFAAILTLPPLVTTAALSQFSIPLFLRIALTYDLVLALSIITYRLSPFHPLANYPGPVLAKVTRFWAAEKVIGGNQHIVSHSLFEKYGDVVRTGPNHLIFRNASAIPIIHGPKDRWPRHARQFSPVYGMEHILTPSIRLCNRS